MVKNIAITVSIIIALLLGFGVWWLFDSGRLIYSNDPARAGGSEVALVCNDEIVTSYSEAATFTARDDDEDPSIDMDTLNALVVDIKKREGYKDDPSCQSILFQVAVLNDDYDEAKLAHEALVSLHEKGRYPNNNILGNGTLSQHQNYLYSLTGFEGLTGLEDEYIE